MQIVALAGTLPSFGGTTPVLGPSAAVIRRIWITLGVTVLNNLQAIPSAEPLAVLGISC